MTWLPALVLLFLDSAALQPPWSELSLSIEREAGYSSDRVTLCRVRVVNHGSHTWPGRSLHFEARAVDGGVVVERSRGRFGLSLPPQGTLETLIGFSIPDARCEVSPAPSSPDSGAKKKKGARRGSHTSRAQ